MSKEDLIENWIITALPFIKSQLWTLSDRFALTESQTEDEFNDLIKECDIKDHAILAELVRVAVDEFGIEEGKKGEKK